MEMEVHKFKVLVVTLKWLTSSRWLMFYRQLIGVCFLLDVLVLMITGTSFMIYFLVLLPFMSRYFGLLVKVKPPRVLAEGRKRNLRQGSVDDHIRFLPEKEI